MSTDNEAGIWLQYCGSLLASSHDSALLAFSTSTAIQVCNVGTRERIQTLPSAFNTDAIAFSHDSAMIGSFSGENVRIWRVDSGQHVEAENSHSGCVQLVVFSDNSRLVLSTAQDSAIRIWCANTGACLHTLKAGEKPRAAFSYDSMFVASSSHDDVVRIWNVETGTCVHQLKGHRGMVLSVVVSVIRP